MLELHACATIPIGDEANLYFRLEGRVILPVGSNIPGEHKSRIRLPREHATPVARTSVIAALIPASTDARFDDGIYGVGLADLVHS